MPEMVNSDHFQLSISKTQTVQEPESSTLSLADFDVYYIIVKTYSRVRS